MSLNRVTLIGRLVRDPELRTTNTGKNIAEFTLAVQKRVKPTDANQPDADFFRCKVWNQGADYLTQYGAKGRLVAVDGRLESRKYVDKDGNNREAIEVVADNVSLLDKPADGQGSNTPQDRGETAGGNGGGGYSSTPGGSGGPGQRPAAQTTRTAAPSADEYDPFADE